MTDDPPKPTDDPAEPPPSSNHADEAAAQPPSPAAPPIVATATASPNELMATSNADVLDEEVVPEDVSVGVPQLIEYAEDGWPLDTSEAEQAKSPEAPAIALPDPKAAAIEAARIVGEIVGDIESAGGAAIVAAAAAGAAIEAARARSRAAVENPDAAIVPAPAAVPPAIDEPAGDEPVPTVRMQRDRILRALAEDIAAQTQAQAHAQTQAAQDHSTGEPRADRGPSQPRGQFPRAASAPSVDATTDDGDEEFDPVQIAAEAIGRLRQRARTDLAELRTHYQRHDIVVLVVAFVIIVAAGRLHRNLVTPPTIKFSERGLQFDHSKAWLKPEPLTPSPPRLIHEVAAQTATASTLYAVEFTSSIDPNARIEVLIDRKPAWSNIVTGLELDRRTRWGELYTLDDSSVRSIAGHDWLRTEFRYAHTVDKGDVPRVDRAIEYATIDREQIYVVTLYGSASQLEEIEQVIAPTLRVPTQTGLPLVPQTRALTQRQYPNAVERAFDSTVMVVTADLIDGRLKPRGGGSGVIVGGDGSIITNYHVVHDKDGRLHDVFVIGRFSQKDHAPQLWCAGRPSRGKLQRDVDLAL
ncbi:MAG: hypothetical protein AB7O24_23870, partial [Kofleriaceae bacterium]